MPEDKYSSIYFPQMGDIVYLSHWKFSNARHSLAHVMLHDFGLWNTCKCNYSIALKHITAIKHYYGVTDLLILFIFISNFYLICLGKSKASFNFSSSCCFKQTRVYSKRCRHIFTLAGPRVQEIATRYLWSYRNVSTRTLN